MTPLFRMRPGSFKETVPIQDERGLHTRPSWAHRIRSPRRTLDNDMATGVHSEFSEEEPEDDFVLYYVTLNSSQDGGSVPVSPPSNPRYAGERETSTVDEMGSGSRGSR